MKWQATFQHPTELKKKNENDSRILKVKDLFFNKHRLGLHVLIFFVIVFCACKDSL